METMISTVVSKDGTRIGFERGGAGPALLLVHGTTADRARWGPVAGELQKRFTVYRMDRRGRGGSGDTEPYSLQREAEDVAAVAEAVPGPVDLLGHSFGAICCLEAALLAGNLRRLVLYEPPIPAGPAPPSWARALEAMRGLLREGRREQTLVYFLAEVALMSGREIELMRSSPSWASRRELAATVVREVAAVDGYRVVPGRFSGLRAPALLLSGGDSAPYYRQAIEAVHRALPDSRIVVLPGQRHAAMNTAPGLFLEAVLGFLS